MATEYKTTRNGILGERKEASNRSCVGAVCMGPTTGTLVLPDKSAFTPELNRWLPLKQG